MKLLTTFENSKLTESSIEESLVDENCRSNVEVKKCCCHNKLFNPLTRVWKDKIINVKTKTDNKTCSNDIQWKFVEQCLILVSQLKTSIDIIELKEENIPANILGVNDGRTLNNIIELITVLGIFPNLREGIGLPLKTKFKELIPKKKAVEERKLFVCIQTLLDVLDNKTLKSIIFTKVVSDVLASLIQLVYRPRTSKKIFCCCYPDGGCLNCDNLTMCEIEWCRTQLKKFIDNAYQPIIVKQLLVLQRVGPSGLRPKFKWFVNKLGDLLSQRLFIEGGVTSVIAGILDGCDTDLMNWERYKSIGFVISNIPKQVSSIEDYYKNIGKEIMAFLGKESSKEIYPYIAISLACFNQMLLTHENLCMKYMLPHIMKPLQENISTDSSLESFDVTGEKFFKILNFMDKIYTNPNFEMSDVLQQWFERKSSILFYIHASKHFNITTYRHQLCNILVSLLNKSSIDTSSQIVHDWMFTTESQCLIHLSDDITVDNKNLSTEFKIESLLVILKDSRLENLRGDIFTKLLEKIGKSSEQKNTKGKNPLLEIDVSICDIAEKIQLASLASALMDEFGYSILQNTQQIVVFIKHILQLQGGREQKDVENISDMLQNGNETINLALMLLSTLLGTGKLTSADFEALYSLKTALSDIARANGDESTRKLAADLNIYITTHGAVKPSSHSTKPTKDSENEAEDLQSESAYISAMKDLLDPLLPTRGHALITLAKLLQARNKYALEKHEELLEIFQANLASDDSYLYLASVDGLTSLADLQHKTVLPLLCRKFAQFNQDSKVILSSDYRLKLSEAIVKSCRLCGEMLPSYEFVIIPTLLVGVKDNDALIRACSLSSLGDVCVLLNFSLKKYITEIMCCICHVIQSDQSKEVRRAAVQLFSLLFKGLDTRLFEIVSNEILSIYRLLKKVLNSDDDDVTRLHADNAITILNDVIKDGILTVNSKLEKKIEILP